MRLKNFETNRKYSRSSGSLYHTYLLYLYVSGVTHSYISAKPHRSINVEKDSVETSSRDLILSDPCLKKATLKSLKQIPSILHHMIAQLIY